MKTIQYNFNDEEDGRVEVEDDTVGNDDILEDIIIIWSTTSSMFCCQDKEGDEEDVDHDEQDHPEDKMLDPGVQQSPVPQSSSQAKKLQNNEANSNKDERSFGFRFVAHGDESNAMPNEDTVEVSKQLSNGQLVVVVILIMVSFYGLGTLLGLCLVLGVIPDWWSGDT